MQINPDDIVLLELGGVALSSTLVNTWIVMAVLVLGALALTAGIGPAAPQSRWRMAVEIVVEQIRGQIREIGGGDPERYLPLIGTLFLFILMSNLIGILPGLVSPAGSLSTAVALALIVLVAVPAYAIAERGLGAYLRRYVQPTPLMAPFNLIGEVTRTIALAVRLYGNAMSGAVVVAILLSVAPFFFPVVMQLLGLLTGVIQAYIFAVLAMVYIASASGAEPGAAEDLPHPKEES